MKVVACTTFNAKGLELYGSSMLRTFDEHWSCGVDLHVYQEGWAPKETYADNVLFRNLSDSPWLNTFKARHASDDVPSGFRMDAVRFSHKVAALALCDAQNPDADYIIWLDGDIVTHGEVDDAALHQILEPVLGPRTWWISWLNRARMYPECGFYVLNRRHPRHAEAMQFFQDLYITDSLYDLSEWHDSFLLQHTVQTLELPARSLSGRVAARTGHPLVNCFLRDWFDHLKGQRKFKGKSNVTDYVTSVKPTSQYMPARRRPAV